MLSNHFNIVVCSRLSLNASAIYCDELLKQPDPGDCQMSYGVDILQMAPLVTPIHNLNNEP